MPLTPKSNSDSISISDAKCPGSPIAIISEGYSLTQHTQSKTFDNAKSSSLKQQSSLEQSSLKQSPLKQQMSLKQQLSLKQPDEFVNPIPYPVKLLRRIPRASRELAGLRLASILESVVERNDVDSWRRLFHFGTRCFRAPQVSIVGRKKRSLASVVNKQIREETDAAPFQPSETSCRHNIGRKPQNDQSKYLASRVSSKLEEGDFRGAVRLVCSEDVIAPQDNATFEALKQKHPPSHPDTAIPSLVEESSDIKVSEKEILQAIKSFPNSSSGGPDGLKPRHLKDIIHPSAGGGSQVLLTAMASFIKLVLEGRTPPPVRMFFFGANLTALTKKCGGIRPIAVGCTLRRLAAKVISNKVKDQMSSLLAPRQLGFGVKGGAEAAVHAARMYVQDLGTSRGLLKLDL